MPSGGPESSVLLHFRKFVFIPPKKRQAVGFFSFLTIPHRNLTAIKLTFLHVLLTKTFLRARQLST